LQQTAIEEVTRDEILSLNKPIQKELALVKFKHDKVLLLPVLKKGWQLLKLIWGIKRQLQLQGNLPLLRLMKKSLKTTLTI